MLRRAPWAVVLPAVLCVAALTFGSAYAGTTGKLTGKVRNEKKEPLAGVNVRVEGQRLGAVTDENGDYTILGIPGGMQIIRANLLGYAPFVAEKVNIAPDFTTTLNIELKTEAIQQAEVRVEAERPLLQKDATGTTRFLSQDDIQKLPTRGYRDAAAQQTGIVNFQRQIDNESQNNNTLIIRGGRPNETAYFVDGFSQQDPLTGTSSTAINNNAIEEVVVMTGGFNPEYGRIMSGAINVVTREGGDKYFGSAEAISDMLSGSWVGTRPTDYNLYDLSFGGPMPAVKNLNFYFSGERRWQRDRSPSFMEGFFRDALSSLGQDPDFKPNNSSSGYSYQGKLSWQMSNAMSFKLSGLGSTDDWHEYLNPYLFNLAHTPRYYDRNRSVTGTFNHVLSTKTFYTLGGNWFETLRKRGDGVAFDNLMGYYPQTDNHVNPRFDNDVPVFFDQGHIFDDYLQRKSSYVGFQGAITSQMDSHNQLKGGGDFQYHTLRFFNHFFPVQMGGLIQGANFTDWDGYGYELVPVLGPRITDPTKVDSVVGIRLDEANGGQDGAKHPKTWSLYGQDKFEKEGVVVNGGLRFDHINVDTPALASERFPLGSPDDVGNLPDSLETRDLVQNKTYARLSPRLGIAFPVDEKTVLRFNYGQFYQQPNLQDLYVSYRFLQHKVSTGGYFVGFGNPNLKPEQTTAYEVGAQRQMGTNVRLDVTAYYKDVKDLVEITNIPSRPQSFSSYRNRDFATIKGLDVGLAMRPMNHFSGSLNYSLSYAQGTGSVSNTQRNIAWTSAEIPRQTAPLDFDQRHRMSINLDWRLGNNEGPGWSGHKLLGNFGINALFNVASGTPYTPTEVYNEVTLAAVSSTPSGPLNSRYGPWTKSLDLKATKGFAAGGMQWEAFVWGLNVFNDKNAVAVYTSTGLPNTTNWLNTDEGQAFAASTQGKNGEELYQLAQNDPSLYSTPRSVRFGIRTSF